MPKRTLFAIIFFTFACSPSSGQTRQFEIIDSVYYFSQIILPAHYKELSQKLGLTTLDKSTDSFSLRLWTSTMFGHRLSLLRKNKEILESHNYEYHDSSNLKEIKLRPKISILNLLDSLKTFNFKTLISQNKIENFRDDVDDGATYTLEICYNKQYHIFQYHSPESFAQNEANNKIFFRIVKILDEYFR